MTWWGRFGLCCLPWLLLGCRGGWLRERNPAEERAAAQIEKASIRLWSEQRPVFRDVSAETAASAWERNLRVLHLKPERSGNIVECRLPEGASFSLTFWETKEGGASRTQGEMVWHDPGDAGRGMFELLNLEKKHRTDSGLRRTNRWSPGTDGELLLIEKRGKAKAETPAAKAPASSGLGRLLLGDRRLPGNVPAATAPDLNNGLGPPEPIEIEAQKK